MSPWPTRPAKALFDRVRRPPREGDGVVTAFRDGEVTLRANRRIEGFTNAIAEHGYQGVRRGDLVIHSMDGFAGAIGVSDSDGKASPVVHAYRPRDGVDARYYAYLLRDLAHRGFITSLAKGIRERSTAFDPEAFRSCVLPVPTEREQRAIADHLDTDTDRIDGLIAKKRSLLGLLKERHRIFVAEEIAGQRSTPLKRAVTYTEGPGIMAEDFRDEGIPLIRVAGVGGEFVTLDGCNFLDPEAVDGRWRHFRLAVGDRVISASASMGTVSIVDGRAAGAIPYTGLIRFRPGPADVSMAYVEYFLGSSLFMDQIDLMKTGAAMQHFGPTHLGAVTIPLPEPAIQIAIAERIAKSERRRDALTVRLSRQVDLLLEHRQALITAAVTGELDIPGVAA